MDHNISYSIVIPVYNSTQSLQELAGRIDMVFRTEIKDSYEIIFVDDASSNKETWKILELLSKQHENIRSIQLMRNFGKQGAMMCGFMEVKGKYVITMDDDLQHFPEDIPVLISLKDHDIVIGKFSVKKHSFTKKIYSSLNSWFEEKLIGKPKHITNTPFKLIKSEVIEVIKNIRTSHPYVPALLFFATHDVVMAEVNHGARAYDSSGFTFEKMYRTFSNMLFNNSSFLLQLIAVMGVSISLLSFIFGGYFLVKKLAVGIAVPGWASLMVVLLFIGGLILFSLGVVGEYLIRIINGIENKPAYLVRKKIGG
ncbi:MAG TPA: glycosyltransferase family 2 protein [Cytophagaceae bacterium]|nr:glycosyltransferase family 2 protein [Cytophagaceae bacterium]